ncbi:ATP-binding protein [Succinimonas sp.]|uniref:ATP-binding protein n=1 Tax=Succinimonas sp. TaxID=1936151 RepID=UPI00386B9589
MRCKKSDDGGLPTLESVESRYQDLSFGKLFTYCAGRGISLRQETFKNNLGLLTGNGRYNLLAQLLSDDCHMPFRLSVFRGTTKAAPLFTIKEFGNNCILLALEKILEYGDVINVMQVDERNRIMERKEIPLFNQDAFREAIVNAVVHNKWVDGNAPMISVFSDRIEILSRGTLASGQNLEGFFLGMSVPVNQKLSDLFLQLHISERSGRGVPKITDAYGEKAFEIRDNSITVILPFSFVTDVAETANGRGRTMGKTAEMVYLAIRDNPNITRKQMEAKIGVGSTTIQKSIAFLKNNGWITRMGSNKTGYWRIEK